MMTVYMQGLESGGRLTAFGKADQLTRLTKAFNRSTLWTRLFEIP
jgi:hypothetical protein